MELGRVYLTLCPGLLLMILAGFCPESWGIRPALFELGRGLIAAAGALWLVYATCGVARALRVNLHPALLEFVRFVEDRLAPKIDQVYAAIGRLFYQRWP